MLSASLKHTPLAALSRPVAGTIGHTLITTLPGSVKAVKENLEALFTAGLIDHALDLVQGGSGKSVHAAIGSSHGTPETHSSSGGGCGHHHHHHHHSHAHGHGHGHRAPQSKVTGMLSHDPTAPASTRHRHSPYAMISLEEALNLIDEKIEPLPIETRQVRSILAPRPLPH